MYRGIDLKFQFTPLRVGRRFRGSHEDLLRLISIHAPPRGATLFTKQQVEAIKFQFTPLREGRRGLSGKTPETPYFNSRPSARGDAGGNGKENRDIISIHAPPRGATITLSATVSCLPFQFTPLREGRLPLARARATRSYFNSRPSARGDPEIPRTIRPRIYFNSRPSARGDNRE